MMRPVLQQSRSVSSSQNTIFFYTMRDGWKGDATIIVVMAWEDICMATIFLKSSILFTYLAGPHSHFNLPT